MSSCVPPDVWCSKSAEDLKQFPIDHKLLSQDIFSAVSGPDVGVEFITNLKEDECQTVESGQTQNFSSAAGQTNDNRERRKSSLQWSYTNRKAFGISTSLYDRNPVSGKVSGDPIADCFAYVARKNNALLVVADGVNWGEKSKLAARCAVNEAVNYIHNKVFVEYCTLNSTKDAMLLMREAFDKAHDSIIDHDGGLTTLNITMVLPLEDSNRYTVCSVNVGDSLTYVFSKRFGMTELSIGSHDVMSERDMRDAGGALGPVDGKNPYLVNLTFSLTTCDAGDIVFLTTDGVSDNFDPVVTRVAIPGKKDSVLSSVDHKAEMLPQERHLFSMKAMELIVHEYELEMERDISAQELCMALMSHVMKLTVPKRALIENPELYSRQYKAKEKKRIEDNIRNSLKLLPGKLDHATIVGYETGQYRDEITPIYSCFAGVDNVNNNSNSSTESSSTNSSASINNVEKSNSTCCFESNV